MQAFLFQTLKVAGLTFALAGLVYLLLLWDSTAWLIHSSIWSMLIGSSVIALIVALYNVFALSRSAQSFVALFLGSMLIRLFLSIIVIGYLLFRHQELRLILVIDFFMIYLCYLVFEIYSIIANLRPISNARRDK